jgi:hypothetical protein
MDEHHAGAFLVSGVRRDDTPVGPLYATSADAHDVARKAITGVGGAVRILRDGDAGWVEVARYTDTGGTRRAQGWSSTGLWSTIPTRLRSSFQERRG